MMDAPSIWRQRNSARLALAELTGSSSGGTEINSSKNTITDPDTFISGSAFELTDNHTLKANGAVNVGSHALDLTTLGKGHDLAIDAKADRAEPSAVAQVMKVSRTHVRRMLRAAEKEGLLLRDENNNVQFTAKLATDSEFLLSSLILGYVISAVKAQRELSLQPVAATAS
jgi:hypothetical protein